MIDRYGVFTASEEDVYELEVNVSTVVCDPHEVFQRVHKESKKIIGQIGQIDSTFV